jgi:RHS repeat-associated protein
MTFFCWNFGLIKIETPNVTIEYIYYHQNRIVLRKQGKTTTTFIHDGWQMILQFDNDKLTHRYLWGTKQDDRICDNDNWTLNDHLNTVRDIVKSDGTIDSHLEYNSFGKIISATKNDLSLQFAYTGKLTDKASELQWNINRWYDAKVGRWVSEDPIGFKGGDGNLYRYVRNLILERVDILGLTASGICKDKCTVGDRANIEQITFTLRRLHGLPPSARDAGMSAAQNALNLSFMNSFGQLAVAYAALNTAAVAGQALTLLVDTIATKYLGSNLKKEQADLEQMIMTNQGFNIWSKIQYDDCQIGHVFVFGHNLDT